MAKVLASLSSVEVPCKVWLGVGSEAELVVSHTCLEVSGYIERQLATFPHHYS